MSGPLAPIRATRTGLLDTVVEGDGDGVRWSHRLGPHAPIPFSSMSIRLECDVASVVLGAGDETQRVYATSTTSLLQNLFSAQQAVDLGSLGRSWGDAIRRIHEHAVPTQRAVPPRTLIRARAWIAGGWPPIHRILGTDGMLEIQRWASQATNQNTRVVHGSPGMAHCTVNSTGSKIALLTGEDIGVADPGYDIVWVLGELSELYHFYRGLRSQILALRKGLEAGYGSFPAPNQVRVGIAFRLLQHAFDWHHYAGAEIKHANLLIQLARTYLEACDGQTEEGFL